MRLGNPEISLENVSMAFGDHVVVEDVSLGVKEHELLCNGRAYISL